MEANPVRNRQAAAIVVHQRKAVGQGQHYQEDEQRILIPQGSDY